MHWEGKVGVKEDFIGRDRLPFVASFVQTLGRGSIRTGLY